MSIKSVQTEEGSCSSTEPSYVGTIGAKTGNCYCINGAALIFRPTPVTTVASVDLAAIF